MPDAAELELVKEFDKLSTKTVELIADSIHPIQTSLKDAFVLKYPNYTNILMLFEAANLCEAT